MPKTAYNNGACLPLGSYEVVVTVYKGHPWYHAEQRWPVYRVTCLKRLLSITVTLAWDHAERLLKRGGLLIEVTAYNGHHAE